MALLGTIADRGDLADAWDDVLPLPFALAALAGLAGWWRERALTQGAEDERARAEERLREAEERIREAEAEKEERIRQAEAEKEEQLRKAEAEKDERVREAEAEKDEEVRKAEEQRREEVERKDAELQKTRTSLARVDRARKAEREWAHELRTQIMQLQNEHGPLGQTDDVRELVLQLAVQLAEADKGLLLSREDNDGDGRLDLVCHVGFDNDPSKSDVAERFAQRVLERDEIVREDDGGDLEGRSGADDEINSLVAIPIYMRDEFSGAVVCVNRDGGFEELEDEVLLALGDHAGAVLHTGRLHGELRSAYVSTVRMLADALEAKDPFLRLHSDEVSEYVGAVAEDLGFETRAREELVFASLLHDVGKIGISERILLKPGRLTPEERGVIELHPRIGYRLVSQVPALRQMAPAVLHHHERFDGGGYPAGLKGEEIPLEARLVCVADCFSAMTSERPYSDPMTVGEACDELERCAGEQFDPQVVRLFVDKVRARPPREEQQRWIADALEDPEIQARRQDGEALLGQGPLEVTDSLTFLYTRRYLHETARAEAQRAEVQNRPFAVVMAEVENIDRVNAEHGYAAGDDLIRAAARAAERAADRVGGTACRYGGPRLAVVMPGGDETAARAIAGEIAADADAASLTLRSSVAVWEAGHSGDEVIARARAGLGLARPAGEPLGA